MAEKSPYNIDRTLHQRLQNDWGATLLGNPDQVYNIRRTGLRRTSRSRPGSRDRTVINFSPLASVFDPMTPPPTTTESPAIKRTRSIVSDALDDCRIASVQYVASGEDASVYRAEVETGAGRRNLVVRIPCTGSPSDQPDQARRAVEIQNRLQNVDLPFRVPRPVATAEIDDGLVTVEEAMEGRELAELVKKDVDPVEITAEVAGSLHRTDPERVAPPLAGPSTRRADALEAIEIFDDGSIDDFRRARSWCLEHLPEDAPSRVLHGDLLTQNILVAPSEDKPPTISVVDWTDARLGDPARELANISRGYDRVFATGQTIDELIDAYNRRSDSAVDRATVHLYELCQMARKIAEADCDDQSEAHRHRLEKFHSLLDRCVC